MKKIRTHLSKIAIILTVIISLQSCTVYHSKIASLDEAINTGNKVKTKTQKNGTDKANLVYKFKRIEKVDDKIYGITRRNSSTHKKLMSQVSERQMEGYYVAIELTENDLHAIYLKNKTASIILSIAIPLVVLGIIYGIGYSTVSIPIIAPI